MTIKLVAVDIDGTLVNSQGKITPEVFAAVQDAKKAGVKVILTTGRPIAGVRHLLEELHLTEKGDYVATFNGGLVLDVATGEEIIKETLSYEDYLEVEYYSRCLGVHLHSSTTEGIYTANRDISRYTLHEATLVRMPLFYRTPEEMADKEIIKSMMIDTPEKLNQALANMPQVLQDKYTIVRSAPFYLEFIPKTVSKGLAIQHLAEKLGLDMSQTMAIGDEENDRSMLEMVGVPVVMENGNPSVKELAKHITKSNDEDGVAYAIRKWVLE